jgi:hypothetical protein
MASKTLKKTEEIIAKSYSRVVSKNIFLVLFFMKKHSFKKLATEDKWLIFWQKMGLYLEYKYVLRHTLTPQADLNLKPFFGSTIGEVVTQGLDNLDERAARFYKQVQSNIFINKM